MSSVLKPMQVAVERDITGGVRITLGGQMGLMSPEQAFEFAMVVLKAAGVGVEMGANFRPPSQKHFRPG
jgi:hypothetical protein